MTILIVEDDAEMRRLIRSLVAPAAGRLLECSDGLQAVAAYEEHTPDWVLMDLKLPLLDGIEATKRIRRRFPEARIVMVTNYDGAELRAAAGDAGVFAYVSKQDLLCLPRLLRGL